MYQIYRSFLPHDVKVRNDSSGSRDWGQYLYFPASENVRVGVSWCKFRNNAIVFEELPGSIGDQRYRQTISWNESTVKIW